MFGPLSFKHFQRRIRSPITLFKKLGKKRSGTKERGSKQKHSVAEEQLVHESTLAVPKLDVSVPSTPSTVSSASTGFMPQTPNSASSELSPAVHIHTNHSVLYEVAEEEGFMDSISPEALDFILSAPADRVASDKAYKISYNLPEPKNESSMVLSAVTEASQVEESVYVISPITIVVEDTEVAEIINTPVAAPVVSEEEVPPVEVTEPDSPKQIEAVAATSSTEQVAPVTEGLASTQTPSLAFQKAESEVQISVNDDETNEASVTTDPAAPEQITPLALCAEPELIKNMVFTPTDPAVNEFGEIPVASAVETPISQITSQTIQVIETQGPSAVEPPSVVSTPSTPTGRKSILKPISTPSPRKRVTSEGQTTKDKDIMSELQASVRSREKKRLEQERIKSAEKERSMRELSVKLEKERLEDEQVDTRDADEVLKEVRSWRKQREASLKKSPDDEAKSAAYREAFAREEIMLELQNSVQRRSTRPFGEDPAEKRQQLVLEEIFAARSQTIQA